MVQTNLILGPPGTGKTYALMELMEKHLASGTPPDRIGYFAFTKKANQEAIDRAGGKFGLSEKQVMTVAAYKKLGILLGLEVTGRLNAEEGSALGYARGDRLLFIDNLARVREVSLDEVYRELGEGQDLREVEQVSQSLRVYKEDKGLFDYTDMLQLYLRNVDTPSFDVIFVDEAQDLSKLQWRIINEMSRKSRIVYIAGDDDQAIFRWAGADVDYFMGLSTDSKRVLDQSYRVPPEVQSFANSIIGRVSSRNEKDWKPKDTSGQVLFRGSIGQLDMSEGEWLVLARNTRFLQSVKEVCYEQGYYFISRGMPSVEPKLLEDIQKYEAFRRNSIKLTKREAALLSKGFGEKVRSIPGADDDIVNFASTGWPSLIWHDAFSGINPKERSYIVAALRRGEKLLRNPRISLSTIHAAKGGESDNVVLLSDLEPRTYQWLHGSQQGYDDECRVFYVGATRAKENLFVVDPRTERNFPL